LLQDIGRIDLRQKTGVIIGKRRRKRNYYRVTVYFCVTDLLRCLLTVSCGRQSKTDFGFTLATLPYYFVKYSNEIYLINIYFNGII